jgi:hypothetical protein
MHCLEVIIWMNAKACGLSDEQANEAVLAAYHKRSDGALRKNERKTQACPDKNPQPPKRTDLKP